MHLRGLISECFQAHARGTTPRASRAFVRGTTPRASRVPTHATTSCAAVRGATPHALHMSTDSTASLTSHAFLRIATLALSCALLATLCSCGGSSSSGVTGDTSETSGPAFERAALALSPFDAAAALSANDASIDVSHLQNGYVAAAATSNARLKFEVSTGDVSMYYDLPNDGEPISCPLSMGDGTYTFTIWENTSGQSYVELFSTAESVTLADEFQPFIRPNVYCDYNETSAVTQLANELTADAQNEGDVVAAVYTWIVDNIDYDTDKAKQLADASGYVPSPDTTLESRSGICFDYASLAAAMLRSQGIPCKIVTGMVNPDNIYHAWNMIYIDGTWVGASINIAQKTWTRIDTTFAAADDTTYVGDGTAYTDRYTY